MRNVQPQQVKLSLTIVWRTHKVNMLMIASLPLKDK